MKLFTVGPVEMYPETLEESSRPIPYFRTPEFSDIMLESERLLLDLANAPEGSRAIFLTASGTGAMEATVINCLCESDLVLTIDGGSFGHRFVQLCERHKVSQQILHLDFGETLTRAMLDKAYREGMTALLVNLHETSVGQLYDIDMLSAFCREHGLLFVVDAISSFLADEIDMEKSNVDVLITSSQKALALAPGISCVVLSPRAINLAMERGTALMYFDFQDYLKNGERGQTPFTPAVGILLTLNTRLKSIKAKGLAAVQADIRAQAEDFRRKISSLPVEIPSYPHSNALTPLYFPAGNARDIYDILYKNYDLNVTPNGGALGDYILRVGHMGNLNTQDNDRLVAALAEILG